MKKMITGRENEVFTRELIVQYPLDEAIKWIGANMNPDEVFTEKQLEDWATNNGFIEEG
jgi:hypothetical protein